MINMTDNPRQDADSSEIVTIPTTPDENLFSIVTETINIPNTPDESLSSHFTGSEDGSTIKK